MSEGYSKEQLPNLALSSHTDTESEEASCCAEPAKRDYFFWSCVALVTVSYIAGGLQGEHAHSTALGMFVGGIFELFNQMWWGIALGVIFVGILARVPRELVMGILAATRGSKAW